jgi:flavin reductase (DIM6/NTAB) family NADH-FMN oxidoreductase RutF
MLVAAAIGRERHTHKMIEKSGVFSISVLDEGQIDLAKHFGFKSGRDTDKFSDSAYETHSTACPVLKDCLAYLDCKVVGSYQAGDHTLFIGEVLSCATKRETKPLTYLAKDYFG